MKNLNYNIINDVDDIKNEYQMTGKEKKDELSTIIYISFVIISFGYMLPWTALGSLISYYKQEFGANFYLDIYIAYYIPGFPISILQYCYDDYLDRRYTSQITYIIRGLLCYIIMTLVIISLIWIHDKNVIIFLFGILGILSYYLNNDNY